MGVVNTTYTFTGTDTITSSKLNSIINDTAFTSNAIFGSSLEVVSPGKLAVASGGITSNEIATDAVETSAIKNEAVTTAKLADASITTGKIVNGSVTFEKLSQPPIISRTAATLSGLTVSFTDIPSWVTSLTIMFNGLKTSSSTTAYVRVGSSGSLATSGYSHMRGGITDNTYSSVDSSSSGAGLPTSSSTSTSGVLTFLRFGTGNKWIITGTSNWPASVGRVYAHTGYVDLSGDLDIIGIESPTHSFTAGSVNVIYQ